MSANFTPDMTGYKGLSPFRFWCQKTLPLVYDDSLSYYELLCKVVNYINNLITDVAAAEENVDKLLTAYNQLQEYVNNYFDSSDFQQKIDDSLDRYAEDGTLSAMVNTHVRALLPYEVAQQIGPIVDDDIGPVVDLKLPAVVESKIAAPVAAQLPAVVQNQIGDVVGNQIDAVVADQIDEVVADQITDAVTPLVHDEVTTLIRPAVNAELPAALQIYLPPEVQAQLPAAIGTDLETIAPPVIEDWLDAHPEATTSVLDGSISYSKLATDLRRRAAIVGTYFPADFTNEYAWQVNQYAVYQDVVYRCIKTTTAGQPWNASEWTTANMNSDLFYMWWCLNYLSQSITTIDSSPATSAHEAGEYFIYYDGAHLYRLAKATSNIAIGATLTPNGNFIYSSVADMIAGLKVEIGELKSALTRNGNNKIITFVAETACNTSGDTLPSQSARANQRSAILDCNGGDIFYIHVTGYTSYNGWAFYDTNGDVILRSGTGAINKRIVAPYTAKKLVINDANTGYDCYIGDALIDTINANNANALSIDGLEEITFKYMAAVTTHISTFVDNPMYNKDWKYAVVSCNEGDAFTITGTGSSPQRLWGFYDVDDGLLTESEANATLSNAVIYAPAGAKKLVLNVNISTNDYKSYKGATVVNDIPSYYRPYIATKATMINALEDNSGIDGDTFIFVTDYHVQSNARHSASLIKYLKENTGVRFVVFGGDTQNYEQSKSLGLDMMMEYVQDYKDIDVYNVIGNHEFNTHYGDQYGLSYATIVNALVKKNEEQYESVSAYGDYWIDNKAQKIRYYFVGCDDDIAIKSGTIKWLLASFEHIPNGYSVIVFSHATFNASQAHVGSIFPWETVKTVGFAMDAVNAKGDYEYDSTTYDFSGLVDVECVAIIGGHSHFDADNRMGIIIGPNPNVLITATTTDAYGKQLDITGEVNRTVNTVTEQAFDVIHFDRTNRTLYFKRIGGGSDRTFTY